MSKWPNPSNCSLFGRRASMSADPRGERLQIMLTSEELAALDQWRFSRHMPSRAAAVRELLRRGLAGGGVRVLGGETKNGDFGVIVDLKKKSGSAGPDESGRAPDPVHPP